ncbi:MAG: single-stranded DNA-binding protein [Gemmatimonadetes bacterium]|nr:single-stranded DNA-binding protein [Gemmatimonadota bacterium]
MSRSLNKALLIGNAGADPEIRTTASGSRVASFSLATTRRWTTRAGQDQEKTEWHRVVAWDRLADIVERFVKKGERIFVEGRIEYRSWEDQSGQTRYATEIIAQELILLSGAESGRGSRAAAPQGQETRAAEEPRGHAAEPAESPPGAPALGAEDELPF